jgi:hypothetical protein
MVALATTTLGSTASTITFGSIPATYRDLRIVMFAASNSGADDVRLRVNSDTTDSNYSRVLMSGNGSSAFSVVGATVDQPRITYYGSISSSEYMVTTIDFLDSSAIDKHKSYLTRSNKAASGVDAVVTRWANTAAITTIALGPVASSFAAGSTFSLYGVVS